VVVAEATSLRREALAALLNGCAGVEAFARAADPAAIADGVHAHHAEVVLLGIGGLDDESLALVSALRGLPTRLVLLTGSRDPVQHARAIEHGAHGVVPSDQNVEVLCEAIRTVCAGDIWIAHQLAPAVLGRIIKRDGVRDLETIRIESLTRRELEVLALVTEGLRNKQIGERLFISEATVRNHLTSILSKLDLSDRFDLAVYAFRRGMAKATTVSGTPVRLRAAGARRR
jgi:DNA-binding NarL/FixJ family response regulator